jgi:hypothetical protein
MKNVACHSRSVKDPEACGLEPAWDGRPGETQTARFGAPGAGKRRAWQKRQADERRSLPAFRSALREVLGLDPIRGDE